MARLKFGQKARDVISGFEGIVTGHASYITGCDRWGLTPLGVNAEGHTLETEWFDERRIEVISEKAVQLVQEAPAGPAPG